MHPVIVSTACSNEDEAKKIGTAALEARLAACVQIGPVTSMYWWNGAIESDNECLVTMKTKKSLAEQLAETIRANHSYEVPEIIVSEISVAEPSYLSWMETELVESKR